MPIQIQHIAAGNTLYVDQLIFSGTHYANFEEVRRLLFPDARYEPLTLFEGSELVLSNEFSPTQKAFMDALCDVVRYTDPEGRIAFYTQHGHLWWKRASVFLSPDLLPDTVKPGTLEAQLEKIREDPIVKDVVAKIF